MSNCKHVAITGYYGTGSSAVIDLLKEYEKINIAAPVETEYEHVPFFYPGGLFDLYSILASPFCSPYNSDMAINKFIQATKNLNEYDYGWLGSYKKYYGNQFSDLCNELVGSISRKSGRQSAGHMYKTRFSLIKALLQICARFFYKRPITKLGRMYIYDKYPGYYAMPDIMTLNKSCKKYISGYINMCSKSDKLNVYDHLLWPQQVCLLDTLFPSDLKVLSVKRDPRDVYLLNKYYWFKPPVDISKPYYSTDVQTFCKEWIETIRTDFKSKNALTINFEDLIYQYDETISLIESFLDISSKDHIKQMTSFIPNMSIENTQIFSVNDNWRREVAYIETNLKEYLYNFPYERVPDKTLWFDNEAQLKVIKTKNK